MEERKALIGSIQKFSTEDGPGVRTTVFLKGCPLECVWCHNPEMMDPCQQIIISPSKCIGCRECEKACPNEGIHVNENGPEIVWGKCESCCSCAEVCYARAIAPVAKTMTVEDVTEVIIRDKSFYDNTGGGVTLSGGEMLMHPEFCTELIKRCDEEDIKVCLDTSGFSKYDILYGLAKQENVTTILYDMKHISNEKHMEYTGVSNELILENLIKLSKDPLTKEKLWLRMPLIEGLNDDMDTIKRTGEFYAENGINHVSLIPYHELGISKARHVGRPEKTFSPPSEEKLDEIKKLYESKGINVEIVGRDE